MRALIVDDELPAREVLKYFLEQIGGIEVIGECEDGEDALEFIKGNSVDVVFLDIKMSVKDGLTTAKEILELPYQPKVVFTTGFNEYAVKAFELNAIDYVMKPYSKERLEKVVKRLKQLKSSDIYNLLSDNAFYEQGKLPVWSNDRLIMLHYSQIVYFKAKEKGKSFVYTDKDSFVIGFSLKELEDRLKSNKFLRTHKSYIVNTEKINEIVPWFNSTYVLVLAGCSDEKIPVSRHYIKEFRKVMQIKE